MTAVPPARYPVVIAVGLVSSMIWLVMVGQSGQHTFESPLAAWMQLRGGSFGLQTLFLHPLVHENGFHLVLTLVVLFYAGPVLEMSWGSARFAAFFVFVSLASGLTSLGVYGLVAVFGGETVPTFVGFGAAAPALAALAVLSTLQEDSLVLGVISRRSLYWCTILLGATGLVILDTRVAAGRSTRVFLLPQVSGLLYGWLFTCSLPLVHDMQLRRAVRRRRAEEERIRKVRRRVNDLLDKIHREGMASLSGEEQAFLRHASKHYGRRA